jgi:hypothetical protein
MITSVDSQGDVARLVALAEAGDIESLLEAVTGDASQPGEAMAYAWLLVVADFGYREAQYLIDELLGNSTLLDNDGAALGAVHHELAIAYLTGQEGLAEDHAKGARHLHQMTDLGYPRQLPDGDLLLAASRARLAPPAREVFDSVIG